MLKSQERRLDANGRSLTFLGTQRQYVGAVADSEGAKLLSRATSRIRELGEEQGSSVRTLAGLNSEAKSLVASLLTEHMRPIANFSRAKLRGVPDIAALVKSPRGIRGPSLVRAARAMATAAAPHADTLTAGGFTPDAITQLGATADKLETTLESRKNVRLTSLSATKEMQEQFRTAREALQMIDAVVRRQLIPYPAMLAVWKAARRAHLPTGARRQNDTNDTSLTSVTVPITQEVKPVAATATLGA